MPGFKQSVVLTKTGTTVQFQPVVLSLDLTPEQRALITRTIGQCPQKLELTAAELKLVAMGSMLSG